MRHIMERLKPGDHATLLYRNRREQFAAAIPYIQIGLERNERCLYIAGDSSVAMVIEEMQAVGIDVAHHQRSGSLTVATPEQTYLHHGIFEPEKMIEGLAREVNISLQQGYSAFRGTGELGWAASLPSVLMRLYEYEALFDAKLSPHFIALCQYNETLFSPELISRIIRIHPKVVARQQLLENPYYLQPEKFLASDYPSISLETLMATPSFNRPAGMALAS